MELAAGQFRPIDKKTWFVRAVAIIITVLCTIPLMDVGEPRPLGISLIRGLGNSLILNVSLWICAIRLPKGKLRYFLAFLVFLSGLGVFIIIAYGWTIATLALLFHLWLAYQLILDKGVK